MQCFIQDGDGDGRRLRTRGLVFDRGSVNQVPVVVGVA
jgi:hypothetical protein